LYFGNVIAGAISIEQAVRNTEENVRRNIAVVATLELDWEVIAREREDNFTEDGMWVNPMRYLQLITSQEIEQVGALPYVRHFDYSSTFHIGTIELTRYHESSDMGLYTPEDHLEFFMLTGGSNPNILDIVENNIRLVDGRTFTRDEIRNDTTSIVISSDLAESNGISIGSTINFQIRIYDQNFDGDLDGMMPTPMPMETRMLVPDSMERAEILNFEFHVIGTVEPVRRPLSQSDREAYWEYVERQNAMYVTNEAIAHVMGEFKEASMRINPGISEEYHFELHLRPIFVINDPIELSNFREAATRIIPEHYEIIDTGDAYEAVAGPLRNMEWIASIILYVAASATLVILSLLVTLFLRDRKHEIGIYLSLGEKRKKVVRTDIN